MIYIDTSAAVKALIAEEGSDDVRRLFAAGDELVSSRLLDVELAAVATRRGIDSSRVRELVDRVALVSLDDDVASLAVALRSGLRALDSLHLATVVRLGEGVTAFVGYDGDLTAAAREHGIRVLTPPFR